MDFSRGSYKDFPGGQGLPQGSQDGEISFDLLETTRTTFYAKNLIVKYRVSKSKGVLSPLSPFRRPCF